MEAYAPMASPPTKPVAVDKHSYEIFSLLETRFLFGAGCLSSGPGTPARAFLDVGRVRVLVIDGCGAGAEDALLAAVALARLEVGLRKQTGDTDARVEDFFDVAAGTGAGVVLAAMLFLRGSDGRPRYSAQEALAFVTAASGKAGSQGLGGRRGRWVNYSAAGRGDSVGGVEQQRWHRKQGCGAGREMRAQEQAMASAARSPKMPRGGGQIASPPGYRVG